MTTRKAPRRPKDLEHWMYALVWVGQRRIVVQGLELTPKRARMFADWLLRGADYLDWLEAQEKRK